jgi:hypothetical protein
MLIELDSHHFERALNFHHFPAVIQFQFRPEIIAWSEFGRRGSAALPTLGRAKLPLCHHRLREAGARSELATRRKW